MQSGSKAVLLFTHGGLGEGGLGIGGKGGLVEGGGEGAGRKAVGHNSRGQMCEERGMASFIDSWTVRSVCQGTIQPVLGDRPQEIDTFCQHLPAQACLSIPKQQVVSSCCPKEITENWHAVVTQTEDNLR